MNFLRRWMMTKKDLLILKYKKKFYEDKGRVWTENSEYFCQCRTEKELKHLLTLEPTYE